jgi:hypothetical protein
MRAVVVGLSLVIFAGCSDDGGSTGGGGAGASCADDPLGCPTGQTCESDGNGAALTCKPSGPGKKGDPCTQGPEAACGDGLFCGGLALGDSFCFPLCVANDPDRGCEAGEQCTDSSPGVCLPSGTGGAGGQGGGI